VYEGYAPHGIALVIETATDNTQRTVANIRSYFNKYNGSLGTQGMLDFMFDRKCSFKITKKTDVDLDELELELIDYGVEEVFEDEGEIMIYAEFQNFGPIQKHLEENHFEIKSFQFERIPHEIKEITDTQREEVDKHRSNIFNRIYFAIGESLFSKQDAQNSGKFRSADLIQNHDRAFVGGEFLSLKF
jgi:transcriptional/translational regulatory protein YebC/TACO1